MPRPEHPGVPLPSAYIRALVERQRAYDRDPEAAERRQREEWEAWQREEWEYQEWLWRGQERTEDGWQTAIEQEK